MAMSQTTPMRHIVPGMSCGCAGFPRLTYSDDVGVVKNALFAGSDGGAESWAVITSLAESCKLNDVDPYPYLADTLAKIVDGHLASAIDELLPWAYARARPLKHAA
jgi:hypothetical protein